MRRSAMSTSVTLEWRVSFFCRWLSTMRIRALPRLAPFPLPVVVVAPSAGGRWYASWERRRLGSVRLWMRFSCCSGDGA